MPVESSPANCTAFGEKAKAARKPSAMGGSAKNSTKIIGTITEEKKESQSKELVHL